ncbi:MAG TPA: archaeoflavoprotein AfpA [Methanothrix sp.]|nr:archaeoflavoprotein AfpA [Methanothrix sp.]HOV81486.1 archaeoflavoprotein AfpA [Methanothrix sp.]HPC90274.1 archaeoflavoprotein AfpA [Methanothrix sp.]HQE87105.1 archaeoflavoprotein AfpA [Methanothrix sp.]HQI67619.1 archaeoflavoprotein AfpA [Methanothrix sp.]
MAKAKAKRRIAWGITGSGDRITETVRTMIDLQKQYDDVADVRVFVSKAGEQVIKYYKLFNDLEKNFDKVWVEINANSPFLAGQLQLNRYDFLLLAPTTSNTVAKISLGLADSLLSNAAIMSQKAFVPTYIMPCDYMPGVITTILPDGSEMKLRIRKEDAEHVDRLRRMEDVFVIERPDQIAAIFEKHFKNSGV